MLRRSVLYLAWVFLIIVVLIISGTQGDVFVVSLRSFDDVKAHASQARYLSDA